MTVYVCFSVVDCVFFFFKRKTAYEMRISDWSSDVCSSDLDALLARFGGEEFVVGLSNHDLHDAVEVAESLRRALVESPCGTQGHSIRISASVGVHTVTPGSVDSIDAALEIADRALYAAKANGRDCVKTSINAARSEEQTS